MNQHLRSPLLPAPPPRPGTTRAADGLPRRKWTAAEVQKMLEAGIIHEDDRFELLGGELVAMNAKGNRHERLKVALNYRWVRLLPPGIMLGQETPLRLDEHYEPEPEFIVFPIALEPADVRGDSVLLVVDTADTTLGFDLGFKARVYAGFGIREYWVINANTLETTVHLGPDAAASRYGEVRTLPARDRLTPSLVPALALSLADLGLD